MMINAIKKNNVGKVDKDWWMIGEGPPWGEDMNKREHRAKDCRKRFPTGDK